MISIVIPVRNEAANIPHVLQAVHDTMTEAALRYEIVAVDDYSTDNSFELLESMKGQYPLYVYKKKGIIGKGSSVYEGIQVARGSIVTLLDADLASLAQYIPAMVEELTSADIVVANRSLNAKELPLSKRLQHTLERFVDKTLFHLDVDAQSGLKMFHKYSIAHIDVEPSKWSFDLEFLYKAAHAGYTIKSIDVEHVERTHGRDQMPFVQATLEMLLISLRYRFAPPKPIVLSSEDASEIGWKRQRYKGFTNLEQSQSAIETLTSPQIIIMASLFVATVLFFLLNLHIALVIFISALTILYFIDLFFNLFLILSSMRKNPAIQVAQEEIDAIAEWPRYTIMCPLYKEWEVVDQFVDAIQALDYPKDKLQVILSLEEVDKKTIEEISKMDLPSYFEILITPDTKPRTKPKACNYALMHTTGEYVVIYDAEDVPDPQQLKKAVAAFKRLEGRNVVCLQAKLNFYNPNQNVLTRLFTLEYSLWFDLVLTGLHSIGAPIPLGGTSNHFKKESLDVLQGWDPFNVTEDCDLGIRLFKNGYKTNVLESITMEEANSSFFGWFKQRSRWIKGYIQTYLVHMRRPHEFITDWSNPHILTFQIIVGFKFFSMWVNPFLWIMTISYFALRATVGPYIESLYITPILYIGMFSLVAGNFLYFYYNMIGAASRRQWDLVKYAFLAPGYWLMMSYASIKALQSIIFAPHYWEKTTHGLHKRKPVTA